MSAAFLALNILLGFVAFGVAGVLFGWLAHVLSRRYTAWSLLGAWALATLGATAAMTARIHQKQSALGLTAHQVGFPVFWTFLPLWAVGLFCVAFTVHRRVVAGSASFGRAAALASFNAFLLGTFAYLIVFAILDITSVIHF